MPGAKKKAAEPSTWAGLAVLAVTLGFDANKVAALGHLANAILPFVPVDGGTVAQAVTAVAVGAAGILPESKPAEKGAE